MDGDFSIIFIGILSCLLSSAAIAAARSVINRLKHLRNDLEDRFSGEYGLDKLGVRQHEWQHSFGNFPTSFLPFTLGCVWLMILAGIIIK